MSAHVLVAGAGLAGLAAARELEDRGIRATVVEARDRVGGRVWTIRDGFAAGQHAEAGGDLIEPGHETTRRLARRLGLTVTPILRRGFGYYGTAPGGGLRRQSLFAGFDAVRAPLEALIADYRLAEQRWDGGVAARLGRIPLASWLREICRLDRRASFEYLLARFRGFRGLFLADPEDLSLLALVDFFASDPFGEEGETTRIAGGNDRLATALAASLDRRPRLGHVLRRIRRRPTRVEATIDGPRARVVLGADAAIVTLPPPPLRDVVFDPPLPEPQRTAIARLELGAATRVLLQYESRFWATRRQPSLFGTDQAFGAVWDGNESQRGRAGILTLLSGGRGSRELQQLLAAEGATGLTRRLAWLGRPSPLLASWSVAWEDDRWAGGGYAVFDPAFDPALRDWLARPAGRVLFAGEHTSVRWQGYMNGAIESGRRAAAEAAALVRR